MTDVVVAQRMWQRRGTAAEWTAANPIMAAGEIGIELGATAADTKSKIGNGVAVWTALPYATGGTSSALADGDKGDITVTGVGTVWTVDPNTITNAKLADVATATLKGRTTASTGDPEDLTAAQARALLTISNVDNTSDANKPISTAQAAVNAAKADLVSGKIPSSQLPSITIGSTQVAASQAAMLALTAEIGDVAVRSDLANRKFMLLGTSTVLADWVAMDASGLPVDSVNGYEGVVVLAKSDIGLGNADDTSDANKPLSAAANTALNLKANAANGVHTGLMKMPGAYWSPTNSNTLNGDYDANANYGWWVNYRGYQDGFTQFRDFYVGDGKGSRIALFQGSDRSLTLYGNMRADFSNGDFALRTYLQNSVVNAVTNVGFKPNGTATIALASFWNASDNTNAANLQVGCFGTFHQINSSITGTGTLLPIVFSIAGAGKATLGVDGVFSFVNAPTAPDFVWTSGGGTAIPSDNVNNIIRAGFFGATTTTTNKPTGASSYGAVIGANYISNTRAQLYLEATPGAVNNAWIRHTDSYTADGTVHSAWSKLWHDGNADLADSGWIAPTLLNSWVNFGGIYATAGYRKIGKVVYLRGVIKDGTTADATSIFNLPVGYRPTANRVFFVKSNTGDARIDVTSGGDVLMYSQTGNNVFQSLDPIVFQID